MKYLDLFFLFDFLYIFIYNVIMKCGDIMKFKLVEVRTHTKEIDSKRISVVDGLMTKVKEYLHLDVAFDALENEVDTTKNYSHVLSELLGFKDDTNSYHIHHLNFDNTCNRWDNLIIIPAAVHKKIHKEVLARVLVSMGVRLNKESSFDEIKNIDSKKLMNAVIKLSRDIIQSESNGEFRLLSDIVKRIRR